MRDLISSIALVPNDDRKMVLPITPSRQRVWDLFNAGINSHWSPKEIKYEQDYVDVQGLTAEQLHAVVTPITYFLRSDNYIIDDAISQYEYPVYEIRAFYGWKRFNESIHAMTYQDMFDALWPDRQARELHLAHIDSVPAIQNKYKWLNDCYSRITTVEEANIINIATEGIHFATSFKFFETLQTCPINGKYILQGACRGNTLIQRDENMHVEGEVEIYKLSKRRAPTSFVYEIFDKALEFEREYTEYMLPVPFATMNKENMYEHAKAHTNSLLAKLDIDQKYSVDATKLNLIYNTSLTIRTNFIDTFSTEYILGATPTEASYGDDVSF